MRTLTLAITTISLIGATTIVSGQTVVENANISAEAAGLGRGRLTVFQDAAATDHTSIVYTGRLDSQLNFEGPELISEVAILTFTDINLDEGSEWYLVESGSEFSAATIAAGEHQLWASIDTTGATLTVPSPFFLGVVTGVGLVGDVSDRSVYGWAELFAVVDPLFDGPAQPFIPAQLRLIRSAVAYDASGIVVGTSNAIAVPEPTSFALGTLAFACSGLRRRRAASHRKTHAAVKVFAPHVLC